MPTKRDLLALLMIALSLVAAQRLVAQPDQEAADPAPPPMVTDRPTDSASPVLVPPRTFQLEMGYKLSRLEADPSRVTSQVFPDLLGRYGISRTVEARLVAAGWTFESGGGSAADGFSDVSLGAKIALAEERGRRPQMALLVDVSLPVGDKDISSDSVSPKVLFLGANALTERLGLTYNIGPSLVTVKKDDGKSKSHVDLNYAVALSGAVGGPFSLFGEFYGAFASGSDRPNRHNFQAGTTILVSRRFQLDVRGGVGLVDNEPDWLVGVGLALRVPH